MQEPKIGQTIKLHADLEEGWPEEIGEYLGDGVVQVQEQYRDAEDDGLRDFDLELDVWSIVETASEVTVTVSEVEDRPLIAMVITRDVALNLRHLLLEAVRDGDEYAAEIVGALNDVLK